MGINEKHTLFHLSLLRNQLEIIQFSNTFDITLESFFYSGHSSTLYSDLMNPGGTLIHGYTWKKQYADGKLDPEPSREADLEARVRELERLLGKVTLENEFLKKAVRNGLKQAEKKQSSLPKTAPSSKVLKGGAN